MRQMFIVSYDISDRKRLRQVFKLMRGYGDPLQLSVFQCGLTRSEEIELAARLSEIIHHEEDQVLFVDVGPVEGRGSTSIRSLGRPYTHLELDPRVI
jgi:CRISPR-associated protein Cas2